MAEIPRLDVSENVSMIFGSLLLIHDWADSDALNRDLTTVLKEIQSQAPTVNKSNAGGWQSPGNLVQHEAPAVQALKHRIETLIFNLTDQVIRDDGQQRVFRLIIDAWGNINRHGDYNVVHAHPNCMWSGCYYVDQGQPDTSIPQNGLLEIIDPREAANYIQIRNTIFDAKQFVENLPGRMVIWPSWLKHMVHPYMGEGERISIAFNVNVIEEPPKA